MPHYANTIQASGRMSQWVTNHRSHCIPPAPTPPPFATSSLPLFGFNEQALREKTWKWMRPVSILPAGGGEGLAQGLGI